MGLYRKLLLAGIATVAWWWDKTDGANQPWSMGDWVMTAPLLILSLLDIPLHQVVVVLSAILGIIMCVITCCPLVVILVMDAMILYMFYIYRPASFLSYLILFFWVSQPMLVVSQPILPEMDYAVITAVTRYFFTMKNQFLWV